MHPPKIGVQRPAQSHVALFTFALQPPYSRFEGLIWPFPEIYLRFEGLVLK